MLGQIRKNTRKCTTKTKARRPCRYFQRFSSYELHIWANIQVFACPRYLNVIPLTSTTSKPHLQAGLRLSQDDSSILGWFLVFGQIILQTRMIDGFRLKIFFWRFVGFTILLSSWPENDHFRPARSYHPAIILGGAAYCVGESHHPIIILSTVRSLP